jgi:hypothetical protein
MILAQQAKISPGIFSFRGTDETHCITTNGLLGSGKGTLLWDPVGGFAAIMSWLNSTMARTSSFL